jgi:hypothetical protein
MIGEGRFEKGVGDTEMMKGESRLTSRVTKGDMDEHVYSDYGGPVGVVVYVVVREDKMGVVGRVLLFVQCRI